MRHIVLLPNVTKDPDYRVTLAAADILSRNGAVLYAEETHAVLREKNVRMYPKNRFPAEAECGIVFGGDGSILDAAHIALRRHIPLLGVNMGRLGYLADLEVGNLDRLADICRDAYRIRQIHVFRVALGGKYLRRYAVNEVTVSRGNRPRIADIELLAAGGDLAYRADGLIIATPTGSTAYSLSAGGAVVDPSLDLITVTPICPHSFFARSLVFSGNTEVTVKNNSPEGEHLLVTIDGREARPLAAGETLRICRAARRLKIMQLSDRPFLEVLKEKMMM